MVKDLKVIFGKGPSSLSVLNDASGHTPMWKKKSIFWELSYWKFLEVLSAIDVMHMTKNLCMKPTRLLGPIWEDKRYTGSTSGPTLYEKKR
jgi:hypothetical protein